MKSRKGSRKAKKLALLPAKNKGEEEGENYTSEYSDGNENNFGYENSEFLLKNKRIQKSKIIILRG